MVACSCVTPERSLKLRTKPRPRWVCSEMSGQRNGLVPASLTSTRIVDGVPSSRTSRSPAGPCTTAFVTSSLTTIAKSWERWPPAPRSSSIYSAAARAARGASSFAGKRFVTSTGRSGDTLPHIPQPDLPEGRPYGGDSLHRSCDQPDSEEAAGDRTGAAHQPENPRYITLRLGERRDAVEAVDRARARVVGGEREGRCLVLAQEVVHQVRLGTDRRRAVDRVAQPVRTGGAGRELGEPLGAGAADCEGVEVRLREELCSEQLDRDVPSRRRFH